ncbi:MAG: hypothetical protein AB7E80_13540 [Hyphomicrobiaceae bacterium]
MPDTDQLLTYILLAFALLVIGMIFWNVLGAPRGRRRARRGTQQWQPANDASGGADTGSLHRTHGGGRGREGDGEDGGHGSDGGGDAGGGDGGGGGGD